MAVAVASVVLVVGIEGGMSGIGVGKANELEVAKPAVSAGRSSSSVVGSAGTALEAGGALT